MTTIEDQTQERRETTAGLRGVNRRAVLLFAGSAIAASALLAAGATNAHAGAVGGGQGGSSANSGGTGGHVMCASGGNGGDNGYPGTPGHVDDTCAATVTPPPKVLSVGVTCGHITYTISAVKGTKFEIVDEPADTVPFSPATTFTAAATGVFTHEFTLTAADRTLPGPDTLELFTSAKYSTIIRSDQVPWDCSGDTTTSAPPSATGTPSGSQPATTSAAPTTVASTPSAGTSTPAATTGPPVPSSLSAQPPAPGDNEGVPLGSASDLALTGPSNVVLLTLLGLAALVLGSWMTFARTAIQALRRRGSHS